MCSRLKNVYRMSFCWDFPIFLLFKHLFTTRCYHNSFVCNVSMLSDWFSSYHSFNKIHGWYHSYIAFAIISIHTFCQFLPFLNGTHRWCWRAWLFVFFAALIWILLQVQSFSGTFSNSIETFSKLASKPCIHCVLVHVCFHSQ